MSKTQIQLTSFTHGIVDNSFISRHDLPQYETALLGCLNLLLTDTGGLRVRDGVIPLLSVNTPYDDPSYNVKDFKDRTVRLFAYGASLDQFAVGVVNRVTGGVSGGNRYNMYFINKDGEKIANDIAFNLSSLGTLSQQRDTTFLGGVEVSSSQFLGDKVTLPIIANNNGSLVRGDKQFDFGGWKPDEVQRIFGGLYSSTYKPSIDIGIDNPAKANTSFTYTKEVELKSSDVIKVSVSFPGGLGGRWVYDASPRYDQFGRQIGDDPEPVTHWTSLKWTYDVSVKEKVSGTVRTGKLVWTTNRYAARKPIIIPKSLFYTLTNDLKKYEITLSSKVGRLGDGSKGGTHNFYTYRMRNRINSFIVTIGDFGATKLDIKVPRIFTFYRGRLLIAGFSNQGNAVIGSVANDPFNFKRTVKQEFYTDYTDKDNPIQKWRPSGNPNDVGSDLGLVDDAAIYTELDDDIIGDIKHAFTQAPNLFLFTATGVWVRLSGDGVITPSNFRFDKHSSIKSGNVKPVLLDESIFFVDINGTVHILEYSDLIAGYASIDISTPSREKIGNIVRIEALDEGNIPKLYCLNDEGKVAVLSIRKIQNMRAWSLLDFKKRVIDICVVHRTLFLVLEEPNNEWNIYILDPESDELKEWSLETLPLRPQFVRKAKSHTHYDGDNMRIVKTVVSVSNIGSIKINGKDMPLVKGKTSGRLGKELSYTGIVKKTSLGRVKVGSLNSTIRVDGSSSGKASEIKDIVVEVVT